MAIAEADMLATLALDALAATGELVDVEFQNQPGETPVTLRATMTAMQARTSKTGRNTGVNSFTAIIMRQTVDNVTFPPNDGVLTGAMVRWPASTGKLYEIEEIAYEPEIPSSAVSATVKCRRRARDVGLEG